MNAAANGQTAEATEQEKSEAFTAKMNVVAANTLTDGMQTHPSTIGPDHREAAEDLEIHSVMLYDLWRP